MELNPPTHSQNDTLWVLAECPQQTLWLMKIRVKKENHLGLILGIKGTTPMNMGTRGRGRTTTPRKSE